MELLRFAHRFFAFSQSAWERRRADLRDRHALFRDPPFPWRSLRAGPPRSLAEAERRDADERAREEALGVRALPEDAAEYPEALRQIAPERRPPLLYLRGAAPPPEHELVGIVGTRAPSAGGRDSAQSFAAYFSAIGVRVVSGLARGVDTLAHERSLATGTFAVLGGGLGAVYPEENQELAERILASGGGLLSAYPLDQVPLPRNFPERNELIAALAAGVVVIEGAERSGAAITARHALAMGKSVVALTQDFRTEFGRGAIRLQQDGAVFVTREEEAVEALWRRFGGFGAPLPVSTGRRSFSVEDFQRATGHDLPQALAMLEEGILQGKIERHDGRYRLR